MSDLPLEDNLYMNDGEWYGEVSPQVREIETEKRKLQKAKPLVRDLVKRLDNQIEFFTSVDSIDSDITADPAAYQREIEANRRVRDILRAEREYITGLLEKHS